MSFDFEAVFASMDLELVQRLKPIFCSNTFDGTVSKEQFDYLIVTTGYTESDLKIALLPIAAVLSRPVISNFSVGAIATGLSSRLYLGANMEFLDAPLSQSVHAEQSAITHAWMKGELGITDITINYSPCGHCRQFMNELSTSEILKIQLPNSEVKSLEYYLPEPFGPKDLQSDRRLMDQQTMAFLLPADDPLIKAALASMNKSYAPYTSHYSGVALMFDDGSLFKGSYVENAAFNPSLPPLQVALVQVIMSGRSIEQVARVALIERRQSKISHQLISSEILNSINPKITLEYFSVD